MAEVRFVVLIHAVGGNQVNGIQASCLRIFFTSWRAAKPEPMITMPLLILPPMPVRQRHLCRESIPGTGSYPGLHSTAFLAQRPALARLLPDRNPLADAALHPWAEVSVVAAEVSSLTTVFTVLCGSGASAH